MFRKIISQALFLVLLGWALPPSLLSANAAMSHAVSPTKQTEKARVTQSHACCPHLRASATPARINLATPCKNDHRCCFLRGPALPATLTAQSSGLDGLAISVVASLTASQIKMPSVGGEVRQPAYRSAADVVLRN